MSELGTMESLIGEARVQAILAGTYDFSLLNFEEPSDLADFEAAVALSPRTVLGMLSPEDAAAQELMYQWVAVNPDNILKLDSYQYFAEILELFFSKRMAETTPANAPLTLEKGVDGYYAMTLAFEALPDEEIHYIDSQLRIPLSLRTRMNARMRIYDIQKLLSSMAIALEDLTFDKLLAYVREVFAAALRHVMMIVLDKKKVGYYSLTRFYKAVADSVMALFDEQYENRGVLVPELTILGIEPATDEMKAYLGEYEEALCGFERHRLVLEHSIACDQMSLDVYERKAMIHEKCPNFPIGLTEREKDYALQRYMKKVRFEAEISAAYDNDEFDIADEDEEDVSLLSEGEEN